MPRSLIVLAWSLALSPSFAQLPTAGALSDQERPQFLAEVGRIQRLLTSAPDTAAVTYQMARTWAAAKQWPEAVEWLRKAVTPGAGIDPSRDPVFAQLRGTREFDSIVSAVREATSPVSHSRPAFTVPEGDLVPESIAYDPNGNSFYLGSMKKGKVIRCSGAGDCAQFAGGLGTVLGVKVYQGGLWLLNNSDTESALIHYDLTSGRLIRKYAVTGPGHTFNDLAIASTGDVYLTDTRAGAVWHLAHGADHLTRSLNRFEFANGIALSPGGTLLYVSTFPDGITVIDLKTSLARPILGANGLCLAAIDGLYFYRGALIAIQNGFMTPRVVRFSLSSDLRAIERFDVLERRNPLFEGITTGVVVGDEFFYMANVQDNKQGSFDPITILKLPLSTYSPARPGKRERDRLKKMGYGARYVRGSFALFFLAAGFHAAAQQAPSASLRPPPTPDEQRVILARVGLESLRYQRELPKLVCTQLTVRSVDQTGTGKHWKRRDRLEVEDTYVDSFLNHKLLMFNGKDPRKTYQQLTGLLSETVLNSVGFLPRWIFGPQSKAKFEWRNWSDIDGRLVHVFSVRVPAADSRLLVTTDRQSLVAGIDGLIYVDAAAFLVRRLEFQMELPAQSVIQDGVIRIDFGGVTISERQFLLPLKAEVTARVDGSLERNQTEVIRYQRYGAESTLRFDDSSEGAPPNESPPR